MKGGAQLACGGRRAAAHLKQQGAAQQEAHELKTQDRNDVIMTS